MIGGTPYPLNARCDADASSPPEFLPTPIVDPIFQFAHTLRKRKVKCS